VIADPDAESLVQLEYSIFDRMKTPSPPQLATTRVGSRLGLEAGSWQSAMTPVVAAPGVAVTVGLVDAGEPLDDPEQPTAKIINRTPPTMHPVCGMSGR
jgi:hypothetical protein